MEWPWWWLTPTTRRCSGAHWSAFVEAGISVTVLTLTLGELGIPAAQAKTVSPAEMATIRAQEFAAAMDSLGFAAVAAQFPDLGLSFVALEQLVATITAFIRQSNCAAVFSFAPDDYMVGFDHPDHTIAGQAARIAATAADVAHFLPEFPAMASRPELYLRTTNHLRANTALPLSGKARQRRNAYLYRQHPSQFAAEKESEWEVIFDATTRIEAQNELNQETHLEYYVKVR